MDILPLSGTGYEANTFNKLFPREMIGACILQVVIW